VDSSLLIAERVLDLVKTAAQKMVPNLEFALAVDLDSGGVCQNGAFDKPRSSLVIISGQSGLQGKLAHGGTLEIPVGPSEKWTSVKAQKHFEKWIPDKGLREQGYDCFISYRWTTPTSGGMDTKLVDGIYKKLSLNVVGAENRQIHVFLDRHCLEDGGRFDKDFVKALLKSSLVIPIVSCAALQKMKSLTVESDDNLLLEWVIIAELQEIGALASCLPVMLGNVLETPQKDGNFTSNIFEEDIVAKLPEVVVSKVVKFVQEIFDDNGIAPSRHLHNRTVKGTVETIMKGLGVLTWDVVSNPIRGANGDDSMMHTHAEWTRNLFSKVATKAMVCIEKAEAQGKSKVGQKADPNTPTAGHEAGLQTPGKGKASAKPFEQWDVNEVCRLVQSIDGVGFAEVANAIKANGIDGKCFSDMLRDNDEDLTKSIADDGLGFKKLQLKAVKSRIDEIDSKTGDSTKKEIPLISSISSGKDKSDDHNDKSSMNLAVNNENEDKNVHEKHFEKETEIGKAEENTKGDRDKDVSEIQEDTSVVQKKWETIGAGRAEEQRARHGHTKEKDNSDDHNDKSSMNLAVNNENDDKNVHEQHFEKVSEIQKDTSVVQKKKWETISAGRVEECLREAMLRGGKPLNTSRLNIVGEGRAGKTAWLRAVSNKVFEDTTSTIGVKQSLLEVNKVDMETKCEGGGWLVVEGGTLIMKADEAWTRLAAQIAVTEPQVYLYIYMRA
jgi:hypothetical protein